jgi:hypothetical protein
VGESTAGVGVLGAKADRHLRARKPAIALRTRH